MNKSQTIIQRRHGRQTMNNTRWDEGFFSFAQLALVGLIITLSAAGLVYLYLRNAPLQQTAVLYVGLPSLIAIMLTLFVRPHNALGITLMVITIGVLMSGVVFYEGIICMVMALPIFLLVGAIVVWFIQQIRRLFSGTPRLHIQVLLALALMVMTLEGTHPYLSFERSQAVQIERTVDGSPAEVQAALAAPIHFAAELPLFLRLGFPTPSAAGIAGSGLEIGAERVIPFDIQGDDNGLLRLRVDERSDSSARFMLMENSTATADWIAIHYAVIEWQAIGADQTLVTWTFHYDRLLDPAWYFGPLERYAMQLAADYLIETVATP